MFDLSKISFIDDSNRTNNYSFVGLQKDSQNNSMEFYLPIGFNKFPKDSFNDVKNLFLDLYKVFRKFQEDKTKDRDGSLNEKGGFEFQTIENETTLLYSKINMFDTILDEFDEMDIYSFHIKRSNSEDIDYSKIDKYIDRAIFLENNIIYLDEVEINRDILHFYEAELVEMFCYIYVDIKKVLQEEESIPQHIITLALNFREKHLTYESSLFEENSFEITKDTLNERLEIIDKKSLLKDEVYDKFYEAIYTFLYGNPFFEGDSDIYWGIDNFSFIWEEMAHYYFFDRDEDSVLFADTNSFEITKVGWKECYKKDDFEYPFVLTYEEKKKYLYPDLIIKIKKELKFSDFFIATPQIYKTGVPGYTPKNHYIKLKSEYQNNTLLNDVFKVDNILNITDDNYQLIEDGYIEKYNREFNGVYERHLEELKASIIRYLEYRRKTTYSENIFYEIKDKIIDFKYLSKENLEKQNSKLQKDIKKQLLYKLAFQARDENLIIDNRFYIPSYTEKTTHTEIRNLHNSDIQVKCLNFNDAKKSYLEYKNDK